MRLIFLLYFTIFLTGNAFCFYNLNPKSRAPLSFYRKNYLLLWEEPVKLQISIKYRMGFALNANSATGLYFTYTQTSLWDIYDENASRSFIESVMAQ